jgi:hypothetical protein
VVPFGSRGLAPSLYGLKNILVADVSKINRGFAQRLQKLCLPSCALSALGGSLCVFSPMELLFDPPRDCTSFLSQQAIFSAQQPQAEVAKGTLEQV